MDLVAGLGIGNIAAEQAIELQLKVEGASGCAEDKDEPTRKQCNRRLKIENQPARAGILRAVEQTSYSRPTPSESATRLM